MNPSLNFEILYLAGTTGAGLAAGCPTMVVPFFGDQAFWGEMCRRSGVGPAPVAVEKLKVEHLTEGLRFLMQPEVRPLFKTQIISKLIAA